MKSIVDVPAPAKLNLFLHVLGRRADGYHVIESAFVLIDWHDTLHFELRSDGQMSRTDLGGVSLPPDDLTLAAGRALARKTGCTLGVHITLEKRIPLGAGLGGGSSDAASTLLALNQLWGLDLDIDTLQEIGAELGADVPFFLGGHNAWVQGIGERLTPIRIPQQSFIVLKPPMGVDTAQVYAHPKLVRDHAHARLEDFLADPFGFGTNDLQPVSEELCPQVYTALSWLHAHGFAARMTGSGSAVFAVAHGEAVVDLPPDAYVLRMCSGLSMHPLSEWRLPARRSHGSH
ncbi:4-(cytidine 5'-diphospho)-2-C-methyl-D-erythritol kinase [Candidatus Symbiobacter mobilis]|uniref:4-diphosphocytidyl-2-C-methyl-D-erythritol kinase n=1 Tax=Candidatus Symbiobacter mobilis CR TaxID=946483 RepID=U5N7H3_9BURK|nr:4-(cytidine 5'-diphospho)-2-C-methyl-D-erythritol kinase [Candidatus Symbiobacter mobilis]AGX87265.1 4-diphosphocytidyl-2C-methyl-D-erythritol kinase [Candidatus Symbiobacter mobilis CR]